MVRLNYPEPSGFKSLESINIEEKTVYELFQNHMIKLIILVAEQHFAYLPQSNQITCIRNWTIKWHRQA